MPDSAAVYQPTTVGYMYDTGVDGNDSGVRLGSGAGIRTGFSRIVFRHKISTRKWLEWVLLSVALCATVAGLTTMLVNLVANERTAVLDEIVQADSKNTLGIETATKVSEDSSSSSLAVGTTITLLGVIMGALWVWLRFFRRGKSQRAAMSRACGQYGPVLTEVPSQMTNKQIINETRSIPLSDQEEETHTLMPDSAVRPPPIANDSNHLPSQLAG